MDGYDLYLPLELIANLETVEKLFSDVNPAGNEPPKRLNSASRPISLRIYLYIISIYSGDKHEGNRSGPHG